MWGVSWYPSKSLAISSAAQLLHELYDRNDSPVCSLLVVSNHTDLPCNCHIIAVAVPRRRITTIPCERSHALLPSLTARKTHLEAFCCSGETALHTPDPFFQRDRRSLPVNMPETTKVVPLTCHGHSRPVPHIHFSSIVDEDQFYIISACKDGNPMLRDGVTGDWIGTFLGHKGAVWQARLSSDASLAATASADFSA